MAEATRAAAQAVADAQAQAQAELRRVRDENMQREAELQRQARHLSQSLDSAKEGVQGWESRALTAELELEEARRTLATYRHAVTPCTAEQMRSLLEHTFGTELRDEERRHRTQADAIGGLQEEVGRLRAQLRQAEAEAAESKRVLGEQTESQKAEHANATHKLREALTAACGYGAAQECDA